MGVSIEYRKYMKGVGGVLGAIISEEVCGFCGHITVGRVMRVLFCVARRRRETTAVAVDVPRTQDLEQTKYTNSNGHSAVRI